MYNFSRLDNLFSRLKSYQDILYHIYLQELKLLDGSTMQQFTHAMSRMGGLLPNGMAGNGSLPNGLVPNGSLSNGSLPNGSLTNGSLPNGTVGNGFIGMANNKVRFWYTH